MVSTPLFIIPEKILQFPNELSYGYLRLTETTNRAELFLYLPKGISPFPSNLR